MRLALAAIAGVFIGFGTNQAASAAESSFREWARAWAGSDERATTLAELTSMARDPARGPSAVLGLLRERVQALDLSGAELDWQRTMLCHMDLSHRNALEHTVPGDALSATSRRAITENVARFESLALARFRPQLPTRTPRYVIFAGTTDPCGQIAIDASWQGTAVREIYKAADLLDQLRADAALPALESMARSVAESRARWNAFFDNVVYDGFPWELYANEMAKTVVPPLRGTLAQPPTAQLRMLHPLPLMSVSTQGATTFNANFGIEALGWRAYDSETYAPKWGLSALVSLKRSSDESTGYGLLATFRGWSLGVVQRDTARQDDELQIVVGVNVAEWIQRSRGDPVELLGAFETLRGELNRGWSSALDVEAQTKSSR